MSAADLGKAIRAEAEKIAMVRQELQYADTPMDSAHSEVLALGVELVRVLARLVEGKSLHQAFGAPGDFGYETALGAALYAYYRTPVAGGAA